MSSKHEDNAEDGCCMCELCWKYGWPWPPWYTKLKIWLLSFIGA